MDTKMKIGITVGFFAILIVVIGLCFFFSNKRLETPLEKDEINSPVEDVVPQKKLSIIDEESNSRSIAVMINNHNTARKYHAGLQDAYMVYELIVEGGITRMMALYKDCDTARIGSIRSARHYYLDYVLENDAIFTHWGYSEYALNDINRLGINNIDGMRYGNTYFWKDKSLGISTEHTAFSSMELINKGIQKLGYRTTSNQKTLLQYEVSEIDLSQMDGAIPANNIDIRYSSSANTSYVYDEASKNYKRSVNGAAHVDYVTKEQYTAKNIITYKVKNTTISGDVKGRQNLDNIGSGDGYYISNGYAIPIKWEKKSRSEKTIYSLLDGTELKVNDGNTYIQIQPTNQELKIS